MYYIPQFYAQSANAFQQTGDWVSIILTAGQGPDGELFYYW